MSESEYKTPEDRMKRLRELAQWGEEAGNIHVECRSTIGKPYIHMILNGPTADTLTKIEAEKRREFEAMVNEALKPVGDHFRAWAEEEMRKLL
jgi:hypothetical protein